MTSHANAFDLKINRLMGVASKTCAQHARTSAVTLANVLKHPNVTCP